MNFLEDKRLLYAFCRARRTCDFVCGDLAAQQSCCAACSSERESTRDYPGSFADTDAKAVTQARFQNTLTVRPLCV
jgi:hypothetical protein